MSSGAARSVVGLTSLIYLRLVAYRSRLTAAWIGSESPCEEEEDGASNTEASCSDKTGGVARLIMQQAEQVRPTRNSQTCHDQLTN